MAEYSDIREDLALDDQPEERPKRSLWRLIAVIAAVIIVILILLLLPQCDRNGSGTGSTGGKTIVDVPSADPSPGLVSVWIAPSANIDVVLEEAGVGSDPSMLEDGKYIVTVPAGREASAVRQIAAQEGVYDAGRVFEDTKSK